MMNIHATKGHQVVVDNLTSGSTYEQDLVKKHLKMHKTYTVESTHVHGFHTDVYLQEVPGERFNSVFFKDKVLSKNKNPA